VVRDFNSFSESTKRTDPRLYFHIYGDLFFFPSIFFILRSD